HPDLAFSLNNLGCALEAMGACERALPYNERALAMRQRLYPEARCPDGHPHLACSLNNMGALLHSMGSYERALPYLEQALGMWRRQIDRQIAIADEAEALELVRSLPLTRDGYLSVARHVKDIDGAVYNQIWSSKAAITRVLERRRLATRLSLACTEA